MKNPIVIAKIYLHKKNKETTLKKYNEKVSAIVKGLIVDKTARESIKMMQDVNKLFNERLDEELFSSLDAVESISEYKKLK